MIILQYDSMRNDKGFTLIEIMVVVVIIGILAAIGIANFVLMQDRAKEAEVKANTQTVHLAVEDYKVAHDKIKPDTASISVPLNMKNPFNTSNMGLAVLTTENLNSTPSINSTGAISGQIGYTREMGGTPNAPYIITGTGKKLVYIIVISEGNN